jgi:transposase
VQALDRTQPVLPLLPHTPERRTHDYVRHGTIDLYAALNLTTGTVIHQLTARHRAAEFKKFLELLDNNIPADLTVHVVLDNSSTHKTPAIQRWLVRHPRFEFHFTPTSSSWMNLVERWFAAELTNKWLRRGTHRSVKDSPRPSPSGSAPGTTTPAPTCGTRPQTRSSTASPHIVNASRNRDTRDVLAMRNHPAAGLEASAGLCAEALLALEPPKSDPSRAMVL